MMLPPCMMLPLLSARISARAVPKSSGSFVMPYGSNRHLLSSAERPAVIASQRVEEEPGHDGEECAGRQCDARHVNLTVQVLDSVFLAVGGSGMSFGV